MRLRLFQLRQLQSDTDRTGDVLVKLLILTNSPCRALIVGSWILALLHTPPLAQDSPKIVPVQLEIVARLPHPPGNLTFTPDNRVIVSHHPMFEPTVRVAELTSETTSRPFPNEIWNTPQPGTDQYLDSVLGLRSDENGVVWMLDIGERTKITPKIVGWNTRTDQLERIYYLREPATISVSEPQDLVVDLKNGTIYIADEGAGPGGDGSRAALIVVDMRTGAARRVLEGHFSTKAEDVPVHVDGRDLARREKDGTTVPHKVGADGIAADQAFEWLYYGPLSGRTLYRIRIADLLDVSLDPERLGSKVERYAGKPNTGGISIDAEGNVYLTEVESRAIGVIPAKERTYRRLTSHPEMHWPDGFSYSSDGSMYVTSDQLPLAAPLNGGTSDFQPPYLIFRFKPLASGRVGH
jgi:sugar lactone lactonase YvrE